MFVKVYRPVLTLLIVGGGHIGQPLPVMARLVGFDVQVVGVHPERATVPQFDPAAYDGMISNRCKAKTIFEHLRADGVADTRLAHVRAPIGLDLERRSQAEIALAIWLKSCRHTTAGPYSQPRVLAVRSSEHE